MKFNNLLFTGNCTRDPELRYGKSGIAIANVTLAQNSRVKKGDTYEDGPTTFLDVSFFGEQAERLVSQAQKGSEVTIDGNISLDAWTDKEGNSRTKITAKARRFSVDARRKEAAEAATAPAYSGAPAESGLADDYSDLE